MVKPLTFKGDKPKKRKHRATHVDDDPSSTAAAKAPKPSTTPKEAAGAEEDEDDQIWVSADTPSDIAGPVVLVLPSETPTCLASDANGKVFASEIENLVEADPGTAEPHDVRQVWVATRVAGSEGFSFKGHHGKFLGCDNYGILSATAAAVSHFESFVAIPSLDIPGIFSLQTGGGDKETFVSVKEGGGGGKKAMSGAASVDVRGDATTVSFETSLRIRMQARFKPRIKSSKESKAMEKVSRKELEAAVGRRLEDDEVKRLRRARREGNWHEAVLDVRVKGKHDKFA